jgi:hypothetical protein
MTVPNGKAARRPHAPRDNIFAGHFTLRLPPGRTSYGLGIYTLLTRTSDPPRNEFQAVSSRAKSQTAPWRERTNYFETFTSVPPCDVFRSRQTR